MTSTSRLDMSEGYLTFCGGVISSTGKPVIKKKIRLIQIKESQTKKMVQENKKCVFRVQYNSRRVIDGSSMSNHNNWRTKIEFDRSMSSTGCKTRMHH